MHITHYDTSDMAETYILMFDRSVDTKSALRNFLIATLSRDTALRRDQYI